MNDDCSSGVHPHPTPFFGDGDTKPSILTNFFKEFKVNVRIGRVLLLVCPWEVD